MKKTYHIDIHPRILELLGPNLYTNIYYVLAELIANAYDADAKNVYVIANKDDITVEDDGKGMSYKNGEVAGFLRVAQESRVSSDDALTKRGRRKMGRKGVGKLAALSVSNEVWIKTISGKERSGFILSREIPANSELKAIPDSLITFQKVRTHGTSVVMKSPKCSLPSSLDTMKKNLLRIFPLVDKKFRLHFIRGKKEVVADDYDHQVMSELCCVITIGKAFKPLASLVPKIEGHPELIDCRECVQLPVKMADKNGKEHEYLLEIEGWIGTYYSTKGRKAVATDFPDNFISVYANKKMGEFNILPQVGQNKMNEVYVVGQLHVDLFEDSDLPDMALSNRQGYRTEDPRYIVFRDYVRKDLLAQVLALRDRYTDLKNADKKRRKEQQLKDDEERLKRDSEEQKKKTIDAFNRNTRQFGDNIPRDRAIQALKDSFREGDRLIGLKQQIDSIKRKILISHTFLDKPLADIVYQMLLHNGVPSGDILYTNCDDEDARIPIDEKVYDYLRKFFVESLSAQKIYVLFVTSENTKASWGAVLEVGAAWITKVDHKIFNIHPFRPEHPLDDESVWHVTTRDEDGNLSMNTLGVDVFCQMIEHVVAQLGYVKKSRANNKRYLAELVEVK